MFFLNIFFSLCSFSIPSTCIQILLLFAFAIALHIATIITFLACVFLSFRFVSFSCIFHLYYRFFSVHIYFFLLLLLLLLFEMKCVAAIFPSILISVCAPFLKWLRSRWLESPLKRIRIIFNTSAHKIPNIYVLRNLVLDFFFHYYYFFVLIIVVIPIFSGKHKVAYFSCMSIRSKLFLNTRQIDRSVQNNKKRKEMEKIILIRCQYFHAFAMIIVSQSVVVRAFFLFSFCWPLLLAFLFDSFQLFFVYIFFFIFACVHNLNEIQEQVMDEMSFS